MKETSDTLHQAVAGGLTIWGLPAIAVVNQTINSAAPGYTQLPTIAGSVNVGQTAINFLKDNLKVSFLQASPVMKDNGFRPRKVKCSYFSLMSF